MADDGGVLGNLPRSRPGRRSEKREAGGAKRPAASAERAAEAAERRDAPAARQAPKTEPRRARSETRAARPETRAARPEPGSREPERSGGSDPVGDVIRTATKVAGTGVRVATGLAHEVL